MIDAYLLVWLGTMLATCGAARPGTGIWVGDARHSPPPTEMMGALARVSATVYGPRVRTPGTQCSGARARVSPGVCLLAVFFFQVPGVQSMPKQSLGE